MGYVFELHNLHDSLTAALNAGASRNMIGLSRKMARSGETAVPMVTHGDRVLDAANRVIRIEEGWILS